jgi:hypothetical protein
MTRISSLFLATTLAILPVAAFAQQTPAPAKTVAPAGITAPSPSAPVASKTANVTQPVKSDAKTPAPAAKTEVHGLNSVTSHHAKANVPAKTAEPAKS